MIIRSYHVEPADDEGTDGQRCFLETTPLRETKRLAEAYECDIGIPNDCGIGNILMYTRIVDDLGKLLGRPLKLLTARLTPPIGLVDNEEPFPLWKNNPFVGEIIDGDAIDSDIMISINNEIDNLCQFSHMIENIGYHYGLRSRFLRPSIYLTNEEQVWAIKQLTDLRRPVVCIHPYGTSSPKPGQPWYEENWHALIDRVSPHATILEIFKTGSDYKALNTVRFKTTLRQMMAIVWASDLFVGFDSAVAHIATAFEIPSLVLWDPIRKLEIEERWQTGFAPATLSRWSYPQNRNLMLLGDRDNTIIDVILNWISNSLGSLRT